MEIIQKFIPFFFLLIFLELVAAWLMKKDVYRLSDSIVDLSCGIISQISGLLLKLMGFAMYYVFSEKIGLTIQNLFGAAAYPNSLTAGDGVHWYQWPWLGWWALAFVGVDFCYYWTHRLSHQINILWAGHIIHHSSEEYNLTVALRQSSLHGLFTWVFFLPLAFAGIPVEMYAACYSVNLIYQFWVHTRLIGWLGPLEYIFVTPSNHRVHHAVNPKYLDVNHGGVFIIWDIIFGTFKKEEEEPVYGITVPLNSWNPVWANVHTFAGIFKDAFRCKNIADGFWVIFGPPGWKPSYLGGQTQPREVSRETYYKFDTPLTGSFKAYALVQFTALLVVAFLLLTFSKGYDLKTIAAPALFVIFFLTSLAELMEKRAWAYHIEYVKLLSALLLAVGSFFWLPNLQPYLMVGVSAFSLISMFWFSRLKDQFTEKAGVPVM